MAKGGHRKPVKRKKGIKKNTKNEVKNFQTAKDRKKKARKNKSLTRQMRGMKWDKEEYSEELEEELEDV